MNRVIFLTLSLLLSGCGIAPCIDAQFKRDPVPIEGSFTFEVLLSNEEPKKHIVKCERYYDTICAARGIYKCFWNEDSYGRVTSHKSEESCRDRLLDLLRDRSDSLGVAAEPEAHMSSDKRADIMLYLGADIKLPIEIKKDNHSDLWTAQAKQLQKLYTIDPKTFGYGIYLVFWFGGKGMKKIPGDRSQPTSKQELELALESLSPNEKIKVFVMDVGKSD